MRILVLGYLVRGPLGGMAWHHLQYVMGLARLGHDVHFLEDSGGDASCYDPRSNAMTSDPSYGAAFAQSAFEGVGLAERWAYFDAHRLRWIGPAATRAVELCRSADVAINVSGSNPLREWHLSIPHRVLIDTDPVFTQIAHLADAGAGAQAALHTDFFSFAENIGRGASVPDDGLPWLPTRQPIVLDAWPVTPGAQAGNYTTVMQWDSYAAREYGGQRYGMKSDSFRPYLDLPARTRARLEIAVGSPAEPRAELSGHGWIVANPLEVASEPWTYQDYIRRSKGEFTVAKHGYVASRSGWFSERSAAYLASGRPVITQSTGFESWLRSGRGVLAFRSAEEALDALDAVEREYEIHCAAARALAEEHFDSGSVLQSLLTRLGSRA